MQLLNIDSCVCAREDHVMDTRSRPLKLILQMENLMTTIERENQGLCLCVCVAQQCHLVAYSNITVAALQKKMASYQGSLIVSADHKFLHYTHGFV